MAKASEKKRSPEVRKRNLAKLARAGFRVARSLPVVRAEKIALRPARQVALRLMALDAVFTWVAFPEKQVTSARVRAYVEHSALADALTDEERAPLAMQRADARKKHIENIGWRLENMWPLAWVLGFEPPPTFDGEMIAQDVSRRIMNEFLPGLGASVGDLVKRAKPRSAEVVDAMEDLFYCAHNAVRSAQLGGDTVPKGFHPVMNGGVIHERRHALTWCLSPGVSWDKTDLST